MRVTLKTAYRVDMIESERGWGSKIDHTIYFDNEAEAQQFALDYNLKHNTAKEVPDWYMRADYRGIVR